MKLQNDNIKVCNTLQSLEKNYLKSNRIKHKNVIRSSVKYYFEDSCTHLCRKLANSILYQNLIMENELISKKKPKIKLFVVAVTNYGKYLVSSY